jgi:hypothetical protein
MTDQIHTSRHQVDGDVPPGYSPSVKRPAWTGPRRGRCWAARRSAWPACLGLASRCRPGWW